jgi:hypothetical protein
MELGVRPAEQSQLASPVRQLVRQTLGKANTIENIEKIADEPVSRILCSTLRKAARRGDHSSRPQLALRLEQPTRGLLFTLTGSLTRAANGTEPARYSHMRAQRAGPALPSYLALHHAGFSVPPVSPPERWALTPPFHPCLTK